MKGKFLKPTMGVKLVTLKEFQEWNRRTRDLEIRNEGSQKFFASACRNKLSGRLFIHVSDKKKDNAHRASAEPVRAGDYNIIKVGKSEF